VGLSMGSSSGSRQSLGIAVIGGMVFATFFSLYLVPVIYSYLSKESRPHEEEAEDETYEPVYR
jgi:multidrug efflux pump